MGGFSAPDFTLGGVPHQILDAGPHFTLTEALSISVETDDQTESDRLWHALTTDGCAESVCGGLGPLRCLRAGLSAPPDRTDHKFRQGGLGSGDNRDDEAEADRHRSHRGGGSGGGLTAEPARIHRTRSQEGGIPRPGTQTEDDMPSDVTADRRCRPEDRIMQGVIPYLAPRGKAGEAADFYMRAFGAQDIGRMPFEGRPDQFIHVQLEINGGARMLTENDMMSGAQGGTDPIPRGHLQLVVQDGQAWWDRAVGAGCMRLTLFEHQFRGDTWGLLSDRFGLKWAVLTPDPTLWDKRA